LVLFILKIEIYWTINFIYIQNPISSIWQSFLYSVIKTNAMLKIGNLIEGDIINVDDEGIIREGTIIKVSHEENQALVDNGVQEFWYSPEQMQAIPLDETQLMKLGFSREDLEDGSGVKYKKDSFRLVTPKKGDFSNIEMWWREDRRNFSFPLGLHEFQNLFHDMTKVHL
jgi:hypothetical protein